jgi:hypothetical protein
VPDSHPGPQIMNASGGELMNVLIDLTNRRDAASATT